MNNNGITLVALVITVLVLAILAGVAVNSSLVNGGIVKTANSVKNSNESLTGLEMLKTACTECKMLKSRDVTPTELIDFLIEKQIITQSDVTLLNVESYRIILSGKYLYNIYQDVADPCEIKYIEH